MAKARDRHHARKAALSALGRDLSRRSKSRCELCGAQGSLSPVEVDGNPEEEPDLAWALLLCGSCATLAEKGDGADARFLAEACWSELLPAQLLAVRILRRIAPETRWAEDTLDGLYLDPETEALV